MAVCRYHGARRADTIRKGQSHPAYRHGGETRQAKAKRRAGAGRLRLLEELMHQLGMTTAKRTPGRKPESFNGDM